MSSHSLGVVIYLNVIGRMTEEISVKNHRDWNSFIECIEKKNKTKIKVFYLFLINEVNY